MKNNTGKSKPGVTININIKIKYAFFNNVIICRDENLSILKKYDKKYIRYISSYKLYKFST